MRSTLLAMASALAVGALAMPASAAPDAIVGSWSGTGVARPADGGPEPVRCRLTYAESIGRTFELSASCAHTHGVFEQKGRVVKLDANRYSGRIYSSHYDATAEVTVQVNGSRQTVTVTSPKGSASATLVRR